MTSPRHPAPLAAQRGFSLVEILVVASIVAVLASIGMAGVSSLKRQADLVRCSSNLKQIGAGILMYASENDSRLPGPSYSTQGPTDEVSLAIGPYLSNTNMSKKLFSCPAWTKSPDYDANKKPYYSGKTVELQDGTTAYPFGYKRKPVDASDQPPRLATIRTPSKSVALIDLDSLLNSSSAAVAKPGHEEFRNALYLDGHVQAARITNN